MSRDKIINEQLRKCDVENKYFIEISSCINVRLNNECWAKPIIGDLLGYINANGELTMMDIPSTEEGSDNVYCDVSIEDFVAEPWGYFNENALNDKKLSKNALKILRIVSENIIVKPEMNESGQRPAMFKD